MKNYLYIFSLIFTILSCEKEEIEPIKEDVFYTISFDTDGGTPIESIKIKEGEKISTLVASSKENYVFDKWINGEINYNFSSRVYSDFTLKATWLLMEVSKDGLWQFYEDKGNEGIVITRFLGDQENIIVFPSILNSFNVIGIEGSLLNSSMSNMGTASGIFGQQMRDGIIVSKNEKIEKIDISKVENLIYIDNAAFFGMSNLDEVILPESVQIIGDKIFYNSSLQKINLYDTKLKTINKSAFNNCDNISNITFPTTIENIGAFAFYDCDGITNINLSSTELKTIGELSFAFADNLTEINLSSTKLELLESSVFYGNISLSTVLLPKSIISIGTSTFYYCSNLENINFEGTSLETIDEYAFFGADKLQELNFPFTINKIGRSAFSNCEGLISLDFRSTSISEIEESAFSKCINLRNVISSNTLEKIGESAFEECISLESVDLSISQVSILEKKLFYECNNITSVLLPESLKSIGEESFFNTINLNSIDLSNTNIETIGEKSFVKSGISNIKFSANLKTISMWAFYGCSNLEIVDLSNTNLTYIGDFSFSDYNDDYRMHGSGNQSSGLKEIYFPSSLDSIGAYSFFKCFHLESVDLSMTNLEVLDYGLFKWSGLKSIILPETLLEIKENALRSGNIESVYINRKTTPLTKLKIYEDIPINNWKDYINIKIYYPVGTNYPNEEVWKDLDVSWIEQ